MEYSLNINGNSEPVTLTTGSDDEAMTIRALGEEWEASARRIDQHRLSLELGGRRVDAYVVPSEEGKVVFVEGRVYHLVDEASRPRRRKRAGQRGGAVTPPMPAVVVAVLVQEGDEVEKGQGLVVVSAMKMETTLVAPHAGTVTGIAAEVDAAVAPGDILVAIEPREEATDA